MAETHRFLRVCRWSGPDGYYVYFRLGDILVPGQGTTNANDEITYLTFFDANADPIIVMEDEFDSSNYYDSETVYFAVSYSDVTIP